MKAEHIKQGIQAEVACCKYLQKRQLKLLEKNFICRYGEIDLIMRDGKTLVFVEVRYRKNNSYGGGLESVTKSKQDKLRRTAELYLQQHAKSDNARFDVVSMSDNPQMGDINKYTFDWITNAF